VAGLVSASKTGAPEGSIGGPLLAFGTPVEGLSRPCQDPCQDPGAAADLVLFLSQLTKPRPGYGPDLGFCVLERGGPEIWVRSAKRGILAEPNNMSVVTLRQFLGGFPIGAPTGARLARRLGGRSLLSDRLGWCLYAGTRAGGGDETGSSTLSSGAPRQLQHGEERGVPGNGRATTFRSSTRWRTAFGDDHPSR